MTGIERLAMEIESTAQEIQILAAAENPDSWQAILGASLTTEEPLPTGRGTALSGMVERGRAGGIDVKTSVAASVLGCADHLVLDALSAIREAVPGSPVWTGTKNDGEYVDSRILPAVISVVIAEQDGKTGEELDGIVADAARALSEAFAAAEAKAPAKPAAKAKKSSVKRGKYAIGKNTLAAMLEPEGQALPVRDMRAFLMSLPGVKPADIALMVDDEIVSEFGSNYRTMRAPNGTLIVPAEAYAALLESLAGADAWYVSDKTEGEA